MYIESSSNVSPPSGVVGLPMLSNHPVLKLINYLYTQEPLDIMAEKKICALS